MRSSRIVMSIGNARGVSLAGESLVEVVEELEAAGQALVVGPVRAHDTGNHLADTRGFRALGTLAAEVDVVDDGGQNPQGGVAQAGRGQYALERTEAALGGDVPAGPI